MKVIITEWSLDSYLNLKHERVFNDYEYRYQIRPDAELLKEAWPPTNPKFSNSKFWGPAVGLSGSTIQYGFKMMWHNVGSVYTYRGHL